MNLGLEDRVVVVTGSSRGIGKAAALAFGREAARVVVTYREQRDQAEAVAAQIRGDGGDAFAVALDLGSTASVRAGFAAVMERWGRIDVVINNAVQWGSRPPWEAPRFEDVPADEWQPVLRANIEGHYAAIQAAVPAMRERQWGRIVNVSSAVVVDGLPGAGAYASAKAALHGLTRTLSKELGPAGILVNVVMPGLTLTERNRAGLGQRPELLAQLEQASPIRRLLPPEEVVPAIVFLGSAANTAVTGEVVRASGGGT